jgi:8-oxo-dGTP diphosphatase
MKERNKAVPAVYLILKRGDEVLLVKRSNSGYYDGWYSLPAGHVEYRELPFDALIRECEEEIGITLKKDDLHFAHLLYREASDETGDRVDMFVVSDQGHAYKPVNAEPEKCSELRWCKLDALPENMVHNVRLALEKVLIGEVYSELTHEILNEHDKVYRE